MGSDPAAGRRPAIRGHAVTAALAEVAAPSVAVLCSRGDGRRVHSRDLCRWHYDRERMSGRMMPLGQVSGPDRAWTGRGLCASGNADPDTWFPDPSDLGGQAAAVAACAGCPVAAECLAYALGTRQQHGVWGGMTEAGRRVLLRARDHAGSDAA